jgi:hypothetical protein
VYFFIPEMKGRSLEEIDELFINRVSIRNFPKHHAAILDMAALEVQQKSDIDMFEEKKVSIHVENTEHHDIEGTNKV